MKQLAHFASLWRRVHRHIDPSGKGSLPSILGAPRRTSWPGTGILNVSRTERPGADHRGLGKSMNNILMCRYPWCRLNYACCISKRSSWGWVSREGITARSTRGRTQSSFKQRASLYKRAGSWSGSATTTWTTRFTFNRHHKGRCNNGERRAPSDLPSSDKLSSHAHRPVRASFDQCARTMKDWRLSKNEFKSGAVSRE